MFVMARAKNGTGYCRGHPEYFLDQKRSIHSHSDLIEYCKESHDGKRQDREDSCSKRDERTEG